MVYISTKSWVLFKVNTGGIYIYKIVGFLKLIQVVYIDTNALENPIDIGNIRLPLTTL